MSRGRKPTKAEKRRRRQPRPASPPDDAVEDLIEGIACSRAAADDYAGMCDARIADLDPDLALADLAATLWRGRESPLSTALAELAAECQRHRDVLVALAQRFDVLATADSLHDHLDASAIDPEVILRMLGP